MSLCLSILLRRPAASSSATIFLRAANLSIPEAPRIFIHTLTSMTLMYLRKLCRDPLEVVKVMRRVIFGPVPNSTEPIHWPVSLSVSGSAAHLADYAFATVRHRVHRRPRLEHGLGRVVATKVTRWAP